MSVQQCNSALILRAPLCGANNSTDEYDDDDDNGDNEDNDDNDDDDDDDKDDDTHRGWNTWGATKESPVVRGLGSCCL